jgi:hypothetical protein
MGIFNTFSLKYAINPWMRADAVVDRQRAMDQWKALKASIEREGVEVLTLDQVEGLPDMVFACNSGGPIIFYGTNSPTLNFREQVWCTGTGSTCRAIGTRRGRASKSTLPSSSTNDWASNCWALTTRSTSRAAATPSSRTSGHCGPAGGREPANGWVKVYSPGFWASFFGIPCTFFGILCTSFLALIPLDSLRRPMTTSGSWAATSSWSSAS